MMLRVVLFDPWHQLLRRPFLHDEVHEDPSHCSAFLRLRVLLDVATRIVMEDDSVLRPVDELLLRLRLEVVFQQGAEL